MAATRRETWFIEIITWVVEFIIPWLRRPNSFFNHGLRRSVRHCQVFAIRAPCMLESILGHQLISISLENINEQKKALSSNLYERITVPGHHCIDRCWVSLAEYIDAMIAIDCALLDQLLVHHVKTFWNWLSEIENINIIIWLWARVSDFSDSLEWRLLDFVTYVVNVYSIFIIRW